MLFTITAVAVMGAALFGSTYTQTQISGQSLDMSEMDVSVMDQIRHMGGLQLVSLKHSQKLIVVFWSHPVEPFMTSI